MQPEPLVHRDESPIPEDTRFRTYTQRSEVVQERLQTLATEPEKAVAYVQAKIPEAGMPADPLGEIIRRESGGRTTAKNPRSTAFGIGQLLDYNRERYAERFGFDPNTTDYEQQLQMMEAYIKDRYGSAANAWRFWRSHGYY